MDLKKDRYYDLSIDLIMHFSIDLGMKYKEDF